MKTRSLPLALLLPWIALSCSGPDPTCTDCNVILVSIDTLRADHLGCYGYPKPTSPAVDELARDSVLFRTAISHAPSTTPSHASIFTSLIPIHHGAFRSLRLPISGSVETIGEIFDDAGFHTVSFNGGGQVAADFGFDRGFDLYESQMGPFVGTVGSAIRWLDGRPEGRFFMFLHTYQVHAPYTPPIEYLELIEPDYPGRLRPETSTAFLGRVNEFNVSLSDHDLSHVISTYDAEIRSMDDGIRALLDHLRASGLYDKTIVLFTSDHGEEFGEHGKIGWHSHSLYDELLHVPFLLKLPGSLFAGKSVEQPVRGIDVLPTLVELAGIDAVAQAQGRSLVALMSGESDAAGFPAISQMDTEDEEPPTSIRTEAAKLIVEPEATLFFSLVDDPGELDDRSEDPAWSATIEAMRNRLDGGLAARANAVEGNLPAQINPETQERLRALGYVQ